MTLSLPNLLSLSRIPIAVAVLLTASSHAWGWAFALLLIGCATDVADGLVAKWQHSGTKFGADVLEPVCDLALTAGALIGLLLTHRVSWSLVIVMTIVLVFVQIINSFMTKTALFTKFGMWFMPLYFLAVIELLLARYATLGLTSSLAIAFIIAQIVVSLGLVILKRHRFADWFSGLTGQTVA